MRQDSDMAGGAGPTVLMTADTVGGVWRYAMELTRGLQTYGVHVVLATMGAPLSEQQRRESAELSNLRVFESHYRLEWMDHPWESVDAAGRWLLSLAEHVQADLIHLNGYAHAALNWSAPVVVVAHSCVLSWWREVKMEEVPARCTTYRWRVENGLRAAHVIVAPSAAMLASLKENYRFTTESEVIPNGCSHIRIRDHGNSKKMQIIGAGRVWDEAKNLALLHRIAPSLPCDVVIAGDRQRPEDASTSPALDDDTASAGACRFLGKLPHRAVLKHLAESAIFAAPAYYEPFGLAILEAALAGCALVLGDIPSLRENWESAAVFIDPRDEDEWRRTLLALSADPARCEELGRQAQKCARQFTVARMAAGYAGLYEKEKRAAAKRRRRSSSVEVAA